MSEIVSTLTVLFVAASIGLFVFHRNNHPAIPAYIIPGIAVGMFVPEQQVLSLSEIGIAFLVFVFGMSLEPSRIRRLVRDNAASTLAQLVAIGLPVYIVFWSLDVGALGAFYVAAAAAMSSSLVGMELLDREMKFDLVHARLSESINLVQDNLAIFAFVLISAWPFTTGSVIRAMGIGMLFLVMAVGVREIAPKLIERIRNDREVLLLISMSVLLVFTSAAQFLGVSIVVGAFAAGVGLSRYPYSVELLEMVGSLKDFFAAVFFVSLGALLSWPSGWVIGIVALLTIMTVALKPLVTAVSLERRGYDSRTAYRVAFNMDQMSEFALILAIEAYIAGMLAGYLFEAIVITATVTMIWSAYTSEYAEHIYELLVGLGVIQVKNRRIDQGNIDIDHDDHAIIVGFDVLGQAIAERLDAAQHPFIVIENDPERLEVAREEGYSYVYGDALVDRTWEDAGVGAATLVVSTVPIRRVSEEILEQETDADIILRADSRAEAAELSERCLYVVNTEVLAVQRLEEHIRGCMETEEYRERLREMSREELD